MTTSQIFLVTSTFLACAVEMVEALTIVLATGITRGWRSALIGTLVALISLAVIVAILGPAIALVPIHLMQLIVGTLMLIFGLQWLRKAILRASGRKALHDEDAIFAAEQAEARKHEQNRVVHAVEAVNHARTMQGAVVLHDEAERIGHATCGAALAAVVVAFELLVVLKPCADDGFAAKRHRRRIEVATRSAAPVAQGVGSDDDELG